MNIIKLSNWSVVSLSPYSAPEMGLCFHGWCNDHPKHKDGTPIRTSRIESFDGQYFHTHSGSIYELLNPSDEYEALFPNAKERFIKQMTKE